MRADPLVCAVCGYAALAAALEEVRDLLDDPPKGPADREAWIIDLQNRLLWDYQTGGDLDRDTVVLEAITATARRMGLGPYDITGPIRRILDELTRV